MIGFYIQEANDIISRSAGCIPIHFQKEFKKNEIIHLKSYFIIFLNFFIAIIKRSHYQSFTFICLMQWLSGKNIAAVK